jgi:5-methylcytosine-specific restriction endonuclease McrA
MADLRRKARPKPWLAKKQGRNRRRKGTDELVKPYEGKTHTGITSTFYKDARWKATREQVLHRDGVCQWCLHLARVTEATEVDHIIPLAKCEAHDISPYDPTNLVASCRSCNSRRASYEAKGVFYETFDEWVQFLRQKLINKNK